MLSKGASSRNQINNLCKISKQDNSTIAQKIQQGNNCYFSNLFSKKSNPSPSKYKSVQCIGFEIDTASRGNDYKGLKDEKQDATERCGIMKEAIESANNLSKINKDPSCLKIFVAPEFFFRGTNGGYEMETAVEIASELKKITNVPQYKDWLFVFGTIVAFSRSPGNYWKDKFEAYNYSLVQKGYSNNEDPKIVMKQFKSAIDFKDIWDLDEKRLLDDNTKYLTPNTSVFLRTEEKVKDYDGNSVFNIEGLRIGVEICLDNLNGRLDRSKAKKESLDVQIVTACGVGELLPSKKLKQNGMVFLCDGIDGGSSMAGEQNKKSIRSIKIDEFVPSNNEVFSKLFSKHKPTINIFETHSFFRNKDLQRSNTIGRDKNADFTI